MVAKVAEEKGFEIPVGFHTGAIIMLVARVYGTIEKVIKELVQNMIDANAKQGLVVLNLSNQSLYTVDNGLGCTIEEIKSRLGKIGSSGKKGQRDFIGEKGIGNLAPIGIAKKYTLMTIAKGRGLKEQPFKVVLDRSLVEGREDVSFSCKILPDLKFREQGIWTTAVNVSSIEPTVLRKLEKTTNPALAIAEDVAAAFGVKIKEKGSSIRIRIIDKKKKTWESAVTPQEFPGKKEIVIMETPNGPVEFTVFLTNRKQKKPALLVDHQGRFQFSAKCLGIWDEISDVFNSGYIQGRARADFCEIKENRDGFNWNPQLGIFEETLLKFTNDYARPWLTNLAEEKDLELFAEIGLEVVLAAEEIIRQNPGLLDEIFKGAVSGGHVRTKKAGEEPTRIRSRRKKERTDNVPPLPRPDKNSASTKEKGGMVHGGVASPDGSKRKAVSGQAGLQIIPGEGVGWRIKIGTDGEENGKVVVNIAHPDWRDSQVRGQASLDTYMRLLVMSVLSRALMPGDRGDIFQGEFEGVFLEFRQMITPKIPGSGKKKA